MKILSKNKTTVLVVSILLGALAGFAYWRFIGCTSGSCPITSNWYSSSLFGGVFGYLLGDSFKTREQKEEKAVEL